MNSAVDDKPLISLVMIVKDEAKSMRQIIESVRSQIDYFVIVDTGSTDDTVAIARDALAGIDGKIVNLPFVDFATTRNASLDIAEATGATFGLLLSGDETLVDPNRSLRTFCEQIRDESGLHHGSHHGTYNIQVDVSRNRFDANRLVRLSAGWRYVGVVHEVLMKDGVPPAKIRVPDCYILHAGSDSTRKRLRLYRDLEMLREQLRKAPNDTRSWYYTAQTLEGLGLNAQAHETYKTRVQLSGWIDECYEAAFGMARTAVVLQRSWNDVQQMYLDAYSIDPRRAEPLHAIAMHWNQHRNHQLAWLYASAGARMLYPTSCSLFVQKDVYDWQLAAIAGHAGYYVGEYEEGERWARKAMAGCPGDGKLKELVEMYEKRRAG